MTDKKHEHEDKGICFTIMPFGGWMDDYYKSIYKPAIEAVGLIPKRADDLYRPSQIINDIWDYTKQAKVILADLTGKNPNVFYELGLAHAITKPAILITETIDDVPFDLRALRVIEYDKNSPDWGKKLQGKIEKAIEETLAEPNKAIPPTFIESRPEKAGEPISQEEKDILSLRNELELLKKEVRSPQPTIRALNPPDYNKIRTIITNMLDVGSSGDEIKNHLKSYGLNEDRIELILKDIAKSVPADGAMSFM